MARYFTHYWLNETWFRSHEESSDGQLLSYCASNLFRARSVKSGDEVYVITVLSGVLYLCAKMVIAKVCDVDEAAAYLGHNPEKLWEANDYIVPSSSTPKRFNLAVPLQLTARLKFVGNSDSKSLTFSAPGILDKQTLRGVRELDLQSAAELDKLLPALEEFKPDKSSGKFLQSNEGAFPIKHGIPSYIEQTHILEAIKKIDQKASLVRVNQLNSIYCMKVNDTRQSTSSHCHTYLQLVKNGRENCLAVAKRQIVFLG